MPPTAAELLDLAIRATTAYRREDLGERLAVARRRLLDPEVRVLVVGEFKQGKSMLVNSLVDAPVCPVDDDLATAVPTLVRHAPEPSVVLVGDDERQRRSVPIDQLAQHVSEAGNPGNREHLRHAEVGVPRAVLSGGLCIVDTPGVGGLDSAHGASTMAVLPTADAVILVSDAAQEYTAPELDFLRQAMKMCPTVLCVLTKTDLYPQWRRIAELNRGHLAAADVDADLIAVSSTLRQHAIRTNSQRLNEESGFPELISRLRNDILGQAAALADRSVANDVLSVTAQLSASMQAELAAYRDPNHAGDLIAELTRARTRADALRERSARWQQTLNDGVSDLIADIEYDLRDRMRHLLREAEEELERVDPATVDEEFTLWLHQRGAAAASANFVWAHQRAQWLARQVAEHFGDAGDQAMPDLDFHAPNATSSFEMPGAERFGLGQKVITGMRGGYGGTIMIGMLSTVAGLALLNPVSVAAGVLLGRKTVKDERKRMLQRRRSEAKVAARRFVDDLIFQVGKESRDLLRELQRTLRDHFTAYAKELSRSVQEALTAAQQAVNGDAGSRDGRIKDVTAELGRVDHLASLARGLGR
ncbi:dynamin family protein [Kutzneria buriramensis]|uniref:Dynamin family protein n=1 Tax=Kutzneria buriramensis TaxID=1045776 RepID=A0A3E0GYF8_9PSEU|nr:dynamin family protein [Kutzneria buriramensis]REH35169.1 dynamin family protein [Kutzneria buriramensis]